MKTVGGRACVVYTLSFASFGSPAFPSYSSLCHFSLRITVTPTPLVILPRIVPAAYCMLELMSFCHAHAWIER